MQAGVVNLLEPCDDFMIVPGILACNSFPISVCVYCIESLAHIE